MVKVRTAKDKGSQMEYDTQYSLQSVYSDICRTAERGFQQQYDLRSDDHKVAIECKRLKGMSWNQAKRFFIKLESKVPKGYIGLLIFKSNQQPALVMYRDGYQIFVTEFVEYFGVQFEKHPSTRNKNEV